MQSISAGQQLRQMILRIPAGEVVHIQPDLRVVERNNVSLDHFRCAWDAGRDQLEIPVERIDQNVSHRLVYQVQPLHRIFYFVACTSHDHTLSLCLLVGDCSRFRLVVLFLAETFIKHLNEVCYGDEWQDGICEWVASQQYVIICAFHLINGNLDKQYADQTIWPCP